MRQVHTLTSPTTASQNNDDDIHCVTQDPREQELASLEFIKACDDNPVDVITSRNCEGTGCGGHPICAPCLALAREKGLVI